MRERRSAASQGVGVNASVGNETTGKNSCRRERQHDADKKGYFKAGLFLNAAVFFCV